MQHLCEFNNGYEKQSVSIQAVFFAANYTKICKSYAFFLNFTVGLVVDSE